MKLVAVKLMKYLSSIFQSFDIDQQEMPNKEVTVGWNAETAVVRHLGDLLPTPYTKDTKTVSKVRCVHTKI